MNDLIIKDPTHKRYTLIEPYTLPSGAVIPVGASLIGVLDYLNPALDNNPTPNNTRALLPADVADALGLTNRAAVIDWESPVVPPDYPIVANALMALLRLPRWGHLYSRETAGTFTYTVPSDVYELYVVLTGAGGSGAAGVAVGLSSGNISSADQVVSCTGGGSGFRVCFRIAVTPGQVVSGVIGAGGAVAAIASQSNNGEFILAGNPGGSSSFGGVTALGGEGGKSGNTLSGGTLVDGAKGGVSSDVSGPGIVMPEEAAMSGIMWHPSPTELYSGAILYPHTGAQSPLEHINALDYVKKVSLLHAGASGFGVARKVGLGSHFLYAQVPRNGVTGLSNPQLANNAAVATATAAVLAGCGGAVAICATQYGMFPVGQVVATSGKGANGSIHIFGKVGT